ncbi:MULTISPECIES: hypothetical protein [unclassified Myroides]
MRSIARVYLFFFIFDTSNTTSRSPLIETDVVSFDPGLGILLQQVAYL